MSKIMNDNFQINVGNPIDAKYLASTNLPYASVGAVNAAIVQSQRYIGLTVNVNNIEYWYENDVTDGSLVVKDSGLASTGVTAARNGITKDGNAVILGGTLTGVTTFNRSGNDSLLQYGGDYSDNYVAQTLVDAEYVTGKTSQSVVTSSNGLTKTDQDVKLGGTTALSESTSILGGAQVLNLGSAGNKLGAFTVNAASAAIISDGATDICPTGILTLDGSAIAVKELASYDSNKCASYTLRSIPDVHYVTGLTTTSGVQTVSNGLTKTGTNAVLGGILTESTTISGGSQQLLFGSTPSPLGGFYVCNTGGAFIDSERGILCMDTCETSLGFNADGTHNSCIKLDGTEGIEIGIGSASIDAMCYAANYCDKFTAQSLIDKQYVDTEINALTGVTSQAITGATNGLTKTGQVVALGGDLTQGVTYIDGSGSLCIGTVTPLNIVYLHSSNNSQIGFVSGGNNKFLNYNNSRIELTSTDGTSSVNKIGLSNAAISITDGFNCRGAEYSGDYECNFQGRTLATAQYVTGITSSIETDVAKAITGATNGLTKTGSNVYLGGALVGDTQICLNNGNCFEIIDVGNNATYNFDQTGVTLNNNESIFEIANSGADYSLTHCSGSNVNLSLSGLTYGGNYESDFNENTLVTKAYVDSSSGAISASNGLTRVDNNITLGGDLTGTTTIGCVTHDSCLIVAAPFCACDVHLAKFHADPTIDWAEGQLYYSNCALNFSREVSGVTLQIGEESVIRVTNVTGSEITNGSVVYVNGASGGLPTIALADATDLIKTAQAIGVVTHNILDNNEGYVATNGIVHDVNTNSLVAGVPLWVSDTTPGEFTVNRPTYPNYSMTIGIVSAVGLTDGAISVRMTYIPNYTEFGLFTGYTATTNTTLDEKLDITDFDTYTGDTDTRLDDIETVTDIALTGATNGLCASDGRNATLGGALSQATTISGAEIFTVGTANNICLATTTTKDIGFNAKTNGEIYLKSQSGTVDGSDMTSAVGISLDYNGAMLVTDNRTCPRGLQYNEDYTSSYIDRSLVDKFYVDSIATGLNVHASVAAATTVADGNQTLTGDTGTIDTVSVAALIALGGQWNRILVKDQTDAALNGIYSATTGDWGRTEDYNFAPSGEISNGDLIPVLSGTSLANSQWINVSVNPIVSGDSLNFSIFSQQQGVTGGDGIVVTTVGSNREVSVDLAASNAGLCFSSNALKLDFNAFTCGLDITTAGEVRVNASLTPATGTEIPVLVGSGNMLYVDNDDFSTTLASNGLAKVGDYISLGGALTGDTNVSGGAGIYDLCFTSLDAFSLDFNSSTITDNDSGAGLVYAADYSGSFVDDSLVSKYFVNNAITGDTLTYTNGLTKLGDTICWGSTTPMTADSALLRNGSKFCVKETGIDVISDCSCILAATTTINLNTCTFNAVNSVSSIDLTNTGTMSITAMNASTGLTITSPAVGAVYAADYSGSFVGNSLVSKTYVDACDVTTLGSANTYTDNCALITLNSGKTYTDNCAVTTLNSANSYTDTCAGTTLSSANSYADGCDVVTLASANSYTDTCAGTTLSSANTYTDNCALITLNSGKTYTDNCALITLNSGKTYTDNCVSSCTITANNGLTKTGNNIALGGALAATTCITLTNAAFCMVQGLESELILKTCDNFLNVSERNVYQFASDGSCIGSVNACCNGTVSIVANNATQGITITSPARGAVYADDYSSGFTAQSLVDKAYVDGEISTGGVQTANNGLTKEGTNVRLGGTLTGDTCIDTNDNGIAIGSCVTSTGANSFAGGTSVGTGCVIASGDSSFAFGIGYDANLTASNCGSFAIGRAYNGGNITASGYGSFAGGYVNGGDTIASGYGSFAFGGFYLTSAGYYSSTLGGYANTVLAGTMSSSVLGGNYNSVCATNSSIIGGYSNTLHPNNDNSVIIGGQSITVADSCLPDHAIVPSLAIFTTPTDDSDGAILVWDSATKKVGKTTIAALGGVTGGTNGLSLTGQDIKLGGALTGDTTITGAHTLAFSSLTAFNASATNIGLTGIVTATGALNVTGAIDGNSSLDILGATALRNTLDVTGATQMGSTLGVTGALTTTTTAQIGGNLTLDTVGAGDVGTDDVLLITGAGVVTKVAADTLGEDNNIYSKTTYTGNQTLSTSSTYVILVNHSSPVTITLPSSPTDGQAFKIKDASDGGALTNNITIARNGNEIDRDASDALINTDGGALEMVYDSSLGWFSLAFVN